jgi:tRNA-splicing ligase RtcB
MCLTLYDVPLEHLETRRNDLQKMLVRNTAFGRESFKPKFRKDDKILESTLFSEIPLLRDLQQKAAQQIGSSGGGNHFVEFGVVEITEEDPNLGVLPGIYFALLSHSGSRGLGANIARHYTKIAMDQCRLTAETKHLAWLDLNTSQGQEYWLAMNLAGDYASACHHQIHERMAVGLHTSPLVMVENHHNFAWKETDPEGNEWIVHRKGATPAGKGVLGIIPGSMTDPGYIVRGKGNAISLNSAAHGAGRAMSRTKAKQTLDATYVAQHIRDAGVHVIGSGIDEAPMAYKNIRTVMDAQKDLVDVLGTFTPKIVRMCGDSRFKEAD